MADRDTMPPEPPDQHSAEPPATNTLPPGPVRDITARFDALSDRLIDVQVSQTEMMKLVHKVASAIDISSQSLGGALNKISVRLTTIEGSMEIMQHELRGVRLTQASQGEELAHLKNAVAKLEDGYSTLQTHVDDLAVKIENNHGGHPKEPKAH